MSRSNFVARLEGLPFRVSKEELKDFFRDCRLNDDLNSIHLILNNEGRASGLGFVELATNEDLSEAKHMSDKNIGSYGRYAKVVECDPEELRWYLNRRAPEGKKFRIRMKGLPFRVSEYEVAQWFETSTPASDVEIHLNNEGRSSGEATAYFDNEADANLAMDKDRADMHGRYVNLQMESRRPLHRSGFVVRMSGLPFRATEAEMMDFFQPEADCVGVRVILNHEGRPSGEAEAEFETEEMAERAMRRNREHLGSRFVILTRKDAGSNISGSTSDGGDSFSIRMGGLPFRATVGEIKDWFEPDAVCSHVKILMNREGRPSGEAIAEFPSQEEADKAMGKNRQHLGNRYVILTAQY